MSQLKKAECEIEELWDEEEKQRLGEVTENASAGQNLPSKVAEGVADKHQRWVSSESPQDSATCLSADSIL